MELSKCNSDIIIQKNTLVTSQMHGFEINIIFFFLLKTYTGN